MRYRNALLFLALSAFWGSAFMAIKAGLADFPPVLYAAIRYDLASVLMLGYAFYAADRWRPHTRGEWTLVGVGAAFMIAGYQVFLFIGEQHTTSAAAAVIVSLSPILTTAFARVILPDERITLTGAVGMGLGLLGVVVIANPDPSNLLASGVVGKTLVFVAILLFALGSVLTQHIDASLPHETMEAWAMLGGAGIMHLASLGLRESYTTIEWTPRGIAALLYLSVFASAVGFMIYFTLLDRVGPIEINLVSYVAPLFAAVTGYLFLEEVIDLTTAVGFLVVVAGFVLLKREAIASELGA
ncbi:MAG: DMT family transporter [Halorientalis sp.]